MECAEEWRDLVGFDGYKINHKGEVKTPAGNLLKPYWCKGYERVTIKFTIPIHRAVLLAFSGAPPNGINVARHMDGNRRNNHPDNLAWGSYKDNAADSRRHGTHRRPNQNGENNHCSKLSEPDVLDILSRSKSETRTSIWKDYKHLVSRTTINRIISGKKWSHITTSKNEVRNG